MKHEKFYASLIVFLIFGLSILALKYEQTKTNANLETQRLLATCGDIYANK